MAEPDFAPTHSLFSDNRSEGNLLCHLLELIRAGVLQPIAGTKTEYHLLNLDAYRSPSFMNERQQIRYGRRECIDANAVASPSVRGRAFCDMFPDFFRSATSDHFISTSSSNPSTTLSPSQPTPRLQSFFIRLAFHHDSSTTHLTPSTSWIGTTRS